MAVALNRELMERQGLYERALLDAFTGCTLNNRHIPHDFFCYLFRTADRDRLRAAGDPLPRRGPYTIYRGVSGRGSARYVKGISWTANLDRERWFASLFDYLGDPAVFRVTVDETDILGYYNGRNEEEFLVMLPPRARPKRLKMLKDGKCSV